MITIDGGAGEGGGQVLRTALGLSLVTGRAFTIDNIRAKRPKPGLLRQHLTAVRAAQQLGEARVHGDELRSSQLRFEPGPVRAGNYHFAIGTAGSCTLVLQAILPALLWLGQPARITLEGGTHNPYAPSFDYLHRTLLPLLQQMGVEIEARLLRPGFYPAGGGKMEVSLAVPAGLQPLELGAIDHSELNATAVCAELDSSIGWRELKTIRQQLAMTEEQCQLVHHEEFGPGNVVSIFAQSAQLTETFVGFGEKRLQAEKLAKRLAGQVRRYLECGAAVGPYLADQLLIPMALAGKGSFLTCRPSGHTLTNLQVISRFLEVQIYLKQVAEKLWRLEI